jgi:hypothetical protein
MPSVKKAVLGDFKEIIDVYFTIELIDDPMECLLYAATEHVEEYLELTADKHTNASSLANLKKFSNSCFILLTRRHVINGTMSAKQIVRLSDDNNTSYIFEPIPDARNKFLDVVYQVCSRENIHCTGIPGNIYLSNTKLFYEL